MAYDRTRIKGRFFDRERARKQITGPLFLLRFSGKDEQGTSTYAVVREYTEGWLSDRKRERDGGVYTQAQIADLDGAAESLIDGTGQNDNTTDFAVEGRVYKVEPDRTDRPLGQPQIWTIQGHETKDVYP